MDRRARHDHRGACGWQPGRLGGGQACAHLGKRPTEEGSKSYTDEYLQQFGEVFAQKGGTTLLETRAKKLVTDEAGTVVGLIAEDAEGAFEIKAKSVILATGGWQCDKEMCTKYIGRHADLGMAQCVPYLDGSGIKMGVEVGAQLSRSFGSFYGHPQPWPMTYLGGVDTPEGYEAVENVDDVHVLYYGTTGHSIQSMGVFVNTDGERFVNEGLGSSLVNQEIMQQHMARAYLILDEGVRDIIRATPFCNAAVIGGDRIDHMIELGMTVVQADSLEELGAKIVSDTADGVSFNAANMVNTVNAYNEAATAGTAANLPVPHQGTVPATALATPPAPRSSTFSPSIRTPSEHMARYSPGISVLYPLKPSFLHPPHAPAYSRRRYAPPAGQSPSETESRRSCKEPSHSIPTNSTHKRLLPHPR